MAYTLYADALVLAKRTPEKMHTRPVKAIAGPA
jgi:hypothetical protein